MKIIDFYENNDETVVEFANGNELFAFCCLDVCDDYSDWQLIDYKKMNNDNTKKEYEILSNAFMDDIDVIANGYSRTIQLDEEGNIVFDRISVQEGSQRQYYQAGITDLIPIKNYLHDERNIYLDRSGKTYPGDIIKDNGVIIDFIKHNDYYNELLKKVFKEKDILYSKARKRLIKRLGTELNKID